MASIIGIAFILQRRNEE
ncbi:hypothetical protein [Methanohalophilus levihalophilus]